MNVACYRKSFSVSYPVLNLPPPHESFFIDPNTRVTLTSCNSSHHIVSANFECHQWEFNGLQIGTAVDMTSANEGSRSSAEALGWESATCKEHMLHAAVNVFTAVYVGCQSGPFAVGLKPSRAVYSFQLSAESVKQLLGLASCLCKNSPYMLRKGSR